MKIELSREEIELTRWCIAKLWLNVDLKTHEQKIKVDKLHKKFKEIENTIK